MAAKNQPSAPEPDTLAQAIERIGEAMRKLTASGLNKRAVMILLKHETGLSLRQIEAVIDGLDDLARKYTK